MGDSLLLYLYGIVADDAPDPPAELRGVEAQPVSLLRAGGVAGIVSRVPAAAYREEVLNARLADLAWVGERGLAHERVLSWFADRGAVIPLQPFSLHHDEPRVAQRLRVLAAAAAEALQRLRGRREWGVKLWQTEAVADHVAALSPALAELDREIAVATPGRRYLLQKRRDSTRSEEVRRIVPALVQQLFQSLGETAEAAARLPIAEPRAAGGTRLVLHAAFLVEEAETRRFRDRVAQLAGEYEPQGFRGELTGPWPPYHFAEL
jgi:hypothetical protein